MQALQDKILDLLTLHGGGLSARQLLAQLHPRISQPTLWRALYVLRAQGALTREGQARATRYHARIRTDPAVLRSRLIHESVAKRILREPELRERALGRLAMLRTINPHGRRYHDRWRELLQGPCAELLRVMTESSEMADVLRKESPLSVFISADERRRIFNSVCAG